MFTSTRLLWSVLLLTSQYRDVSADCLQTARSNHHYQSIDERQMCNSYTSSVISFGHITEKALQPETNALQNISKDVSIRVGFRLSFIFKTGRKAQRVEHNWLFRHHRRVPIFRLSLNSVQFCLQYRRLCRCIQRKMLDGTENLSWLLFALAFLGD